MTRNRRYDAVPGKIIRFECRDERVRYVTFECGEFGSFTFAFSPGASFDWTTDRRNIEFQFQDEDEKIPPWDALIPVKGLDPDDAVDHKRLENSQENPSNMEIRQIPLSAGNLSPKLAGIVDALIKLFNDAPEMSERERNRKYRKHYDEIFRKMVDEGMDYQEASMQPELYNQDSESFFAKLKSKDQNLEWQCDTVAASFRRYLEIGQVPPPYFPMRVAILLRKVKQHDREKRFLAAWCRHFPSGNGVKYGKIVERARKLGAID